jgi:hypothetical protein
MINLFIVVHHGSGWLQFSVIWLSLIKKFQMNDSERYPIKSVNCDEIHDDLIRAAAACGGNSRYAGSVGRVERWIMQPSFTILCPC